MNGKKRRRPRKWRWILVTLLVGGAGYAVWVGPDPSITIAPGLPGIGRRTPVRVIFEEPRRGLGRIKLELVQGERSEMLAEGEHTPRPAWKLWGERTPSELMALEVGRETVEWLAEGSATLRASAWPAGALLRSPPPVIEELTLPVRLTPPRLEILSRHHYVAQGGAEAVVYRAGAESVRDGVLVGEKLFPGFALPGGAARERFALFSIPFDHTDVSDITLLTEDELGNRALLPFVDRLHEKKYRTDTIELSEPFLRKVVPAILASTPELRQQGSLLESYLLINGELRRRNAQTLIELAAVSQPRLLWRRPFRAMPNAKVMSAFADRRTYLFDGREVDRQDHLGFDLASIRRAEVPAANSGSVVLARYLGIYGNSVVIDHGYGLMSLYGHLSSIEVAEGETVKLGQTVGRTGETGLAGGDHLHFTMLLQGEAVTPLEWWDAGWIRDHVARKLGQALPFEP